MSESLEVESPFSNNNFFTGISTYLSVFRVPENSCNFSLLQCKLDSRLLTQPRLVHIPTFLARSESLPRPDSRTLPVLGPDNLLDLLDGPTSLPLCRPFPLLLHSTPISPSVACPNRWTVHLVTEGSTNVYRRARRFRPESRALFLPKGRGRRE